EYSGHVEAVKRFFAEAQAVNRINHENIIEVSDFVENPSGASFYIMELLKGVDLRTLEDREGTLPLPRALGIAIQLCRGLAAAHDAGIIHRDLKPDNVFLVERQGRTDFVKILDFGIAKLMNAALDDAVTFKSTAGIVVGTPDYMSPEQAMGQQVDHRSDVYAVGVILFEMVAGRRPFEAETAREIMVKHMMVTPPRPSRFRSVTNPLPPALEDVIMACLKKEPRDRPDSIKDVGNRLQEILDGLGGTGRSAWVTSAVRDRRVWLAASGLALLLVGAFAFPRHRPRLAPAAETAVAPVSPKVPESVELRFQSSPPGATVFRVGDAQPLGTTPFAASFDRASRVEVFEFRLDGWQVGRKDLSLLENATVEVSLVPGERDMREATANLASSTQREASNGSGSRASGAGRRPGQTSKPSPKRAKLELDRDAVMNPFE
ncbi:MAG TPA: serine/threonine-protein kinase, partial [Polyangia bacterium]|nr:serine/threonine-protein kinase [Polyangia bacterium]